MVNTPAMQNPKDTMPHPVAWTVPRRILGAVANLGLLAWCVFSLMNFPRIEMPMVSEFVAAEGLRLLVGLFESLALLFVVLATWWTLHRVIAPRSSAAALRTLAEEPR